MNISASATASAGNSVLEQFAAARPAARAARTSRSAPARSRRRETPPRCCARGSGGCRLPGPRDRRRGSPSHAAPAPAPKITSALVATNGACRPCARPRRLSTSTIARPPTIPMMVPSTASLASEMTTCCQDHRSPISRNSTSTMVRKIANGSLMPDSTSSVAPTRGRSRSPLGMDQEEHRRRVGRGHHRADQKRLGPVHAEHVSWRTARSAPPSAARRGSRAPSPAPARCGRSKAACAGRRRTGSARARSSRPHRSRARRRT